MGENIADLGGLGIAYKAYQLSLQGKERKVLDGFNPDQRFFIGWAQVWARKYTKEEMEKRLLTDPHAPSEYRVNGIVSNLPAFYEAFAVEDHHPMYIPENDRVKIW